MDGKEPPFLKLWRKPIKNGVLRILGKENWQTLCALAVFMNEKGECHPSLKLLTHFIGLASISAASDRIRNLEKAKWNGKSVVTVIRRKSLKRNGKILWENNHYVINTEIVSIFSDSPPDEMETKLNDIPSSVSVGDEHNQKKISNQNLTRRPLRGEIENGKELLRKTVERLRGKS